MKKRFEIIAEIDENYEFCDFFLRTILWDKEKERSEFIDMPINIRHMPEEAE